MVLEHLSTKTSKAAQEQRFRNTDNSEWGPHAAQAMCDQTRDFSISFGGGKKTLGDIYDKTPKERIVKVMLEEKVFKTWSSGRTVLLGVGKRLAVGVFVLVKCNVPVSVQGRLYLFASLILFSLPQGQPVCWSR